MTVPTGILSTLATSAYDRSSTATRSSTERCSSGIDRYVPAACCPATELIDCEVVQDREQPRTRIVFTSPIPMADGPLQTILHQIVGGGMIADQRACVTAQRWNHRLDQVQHVVHRV
jgi:hypothetical protein